MIEIIFYIIFIYCIWQITSNLIDIIKLCIKFVFELILCIIYDLFIFIYNHIMLSIYKRK